MAYLSSVLLFGLACLPFSRAFFEIRTRAPRYRTHEGMRKEFFENQLFLYLDAESVTQIKAGNEPFNTPEWCCGKKNWANKFYLKDNVLLNNFCSRRANIVELERRAIFKYVTCFHECLFYHMELINELGQLNVPLVRTIFVNFVFTEEEIRGVSDFVLDNCIAKWKSTPITSQSCIEAPEEFMHCLFLNLYKVCPKNLKNTEIFCSHHLYKVQLMELTTPVYIPKSDSDEFL